MPEYSPSCLPPPPPYDLVAVVPPPQSSTTPPTTPSPASVALPTPKRTLEPQIFVDAEQRSADWPNKKPRQQQQQQKTLRCAETKAKPSIFSEDKENLVEMRDGDSGKKGTGGAGGSLPPMIEPLRPRVLLPLANPPSYWGYYRDVEREILGDTNSDGTPRRPDRRRIQGSGLWDGP